MREHSEIRLIGRAVKERWPISREQAQELVRDMSLAAKGGDRCAVSAAKVMVAMMGQNQADEHKAIDVSIQFRNDQLSRIAAELGIDPALIIDAQGQGGGGDAGNGSHANPPGVGPAAEAGEEA